MKKLILLLLVMPAPSIAMHKSSGKNKIIEISGKHRTGKRKKKPIYLTGFSEVEQRASKVLVEKLVKNGLGYPNDILQVIPLLEELPITINQKKQLKNLYKQELNLFVQIVDSSGIQEGVGTKAQHLIVLKQLLDNLRTCKAVIDKSKSGSAYFDSEDIPIAPPE